MSRTTAFPATIAARLLAAGELDLGPGVYPPEKLGLAGTFEHFLSGLELRGVHYSFEREALA